MSAIKMSAINGSKVRELRKALGYSQQELSKETGIPRGTIAAIEAGFSRQPSFAVVSAIAKALKVHPESLFLPTNVDGSTIDPNPAA